MNTVALFVLLGLSLTYAHPMFQAQMDEIINSSPCLKRCVDQVTESKLELTISRTTNYGEYFGNFDKICEVIASARECIDKCGIESNPFKLKSTTFMCQPEMRAYVKEFTPCMEKEQPSVTTECTKQCGDVAKLDTEITVLQNEMTSNPQSSRPEQFDDFMTKTNENCKMTKCFARCSRQAFNTKCGQVGSIPTGEFLKAFVDEVLDMTHKDLVEMDLVGTLVHNVPPECDFMYTDGVMFNDREDQKVIKAVDQAMKEEQKEMMQEQQHAQSDEQMEALQQTILIKQLELLKKQEKVVDKENLKLDLEISKLKNKFSF